MRWQQASNSRIVDAEGREYLDFTSGVISANVGHGAQEVQDAIQELLDRPLLHCYRYDFAERAALTAELLEFTGGSFTEVHYGAGGASAVETALRLCARWAASRGVPLRVVSFQRSFHGKSLGAAILSDISRYRPPGLVEAAWVMKLPFPSSPELGTRVMAALAREVGRVSGVFVECTQGSTLESIDGDTLSALRSFCDASEAFLVVDEIQTGFFRLGRPFAFQRFGVEPDVLCVGKGLTSSLPLSALLLGAHPAQQLVLDLDDETHMANPLAVSAARACLRIYRSAAFLRNLRQSEAVFARRLRAMAGSLPSWIRVKGTPGLLGGFHFDTAVAGPAEITAVVEDCRAAGLFLAGPVGEEKDLLKLSPPLVITAAEVDRAFEVMEMVLSNRQCATSKARSTP